MADLTLHDILSLSDPLNEDTANFLCDFKEEDEHVDFKSLFDFQSEKSWVELTKDILSFANTFGGFLIFGIDDKSRSVIGISDKEADILIDTNNIQQKVNKYIDPKLTSIRSKKFYINKCNIVIIYIPQSKNITHIISKDGEFKYPSGTKGTAFRKGTFYVRHSAANHLGDDHDFEKIIERRIDQFRESLMNKVAKVVNSTVESEVYILKKDDTVQNGDTKRFIIEDSPDAIAIKGMSFTIAPQGIEEQVSAWKVLSDGKNNIYPPEEEIWSWYTERESCNLQKSLKLAIFKFSLRYAIPCFYWIRALQAQEIQEVLLESIRHRQPNIDGAYLMKVSSFLGKSFYQRAYHTFGEYKERLGDRLKSYPTQDLLTEFADLPTYRDKSRKELEEIINEIANKRKNNKIGLQELWKAQKIDCLLYSQSDKYA